MPTAIFRADAGPIIGSGHVMRCLALAKVLSGVGWRCHFASVDGVTNPIPALTSSRFNCIELPKDVSNQVVVLQNAFPEGVGLLVIDQYDLNIEFELACRSWANRIFVIDDLANRVHDADILLDQTHGRNSEDYRCLVPKHCAIYTGARYALIQPEFISTRAVALARRDSGTGSIKHILVTLGATDPEGVTSIILDGIRKSEIDATVDVVLGSWAPHTRIIKTAAGRSPQMRGLVSTIEMAKLMTKADLALGAGGTTSWERCCLGLPALLVTMADNQDTINRTLNRIGAIKHLGRSTVIDPFLVSKEIQTLIEHPEQLKAMSKVARGICDGRGPLRILLLLVGSHLTRIGEKVSLRLMELEDEEMILAWQSSKDIRIYSRNKEVPDPVTHTAWMHREVHDPTCLPMVVQYRDSAAGLMRFNRTIDKEVEVSILITPEYQGVGVATAALQLGKRVFPGCELWAKICPNNLPSIKSFTKAGYQATKFPGWHKVSAEG